MKLKIILLLLTAITFASCNFNKFLVQPDKIPADKKTAYMAVAKTDNNGKTTIDSTVFHFGANFQPTITDARNNVIPLDYTIESVVFKNDAGTDLNGWMIKPKNAVPTITLLFLHGNGGDILTHYPTVLPLVRKGFQVFIVDYSGFGFSKGKATRKNVLKDGEAALKYVHSREDVKNTSLIVYGQSMGAHFTPGVAASHQEMTDGMVIEGGFYSYKAIAADHIALGFVARILVKEGYSIGKALKEYRKPLLVIHSSEDEMVPLPMGIKIFKAANDPKSYYEIAKCHMCGPVFYSDKISEKIREMVKK